MAYCNSVSIQRATQISVYRRQGIDQSGYNSLREPTSYLKRSCTASRSNSADQSQTAANVPVKAGGRGQPDNNLVFCSAVQSCAVLLGAVFCTGCRVISYMYRVDLRCRSETIAKQKSQVVYVCFLTAILKK